MNGFDFAIESDPAVRFQTNDADLFNINKLALKPVTRDDVAVFRMDLCNDQVDRHFSRFPEKELRRINELVVGKPLMELHDTDGRQPRGAFFQSQINRTGATVSVQPDVYILRTNKNEDFITHIEGGVYRGTSIGFQFERPECSVCASDLRGCAHWPGETYDGQQCHYIMHDVSDVYEGSVVPLGSQGTEFVEARALPLIGAGDTFQERNHALKNARANQTAVELTSRNAKAEFYEVVAGLDEQIKNANSVSKRLYDRLDDATIGRETSQN